ncbi:hypothetical protein KO516_10225 [Citreicella sp. C3M06]|uniref:hypothetical protein n=1 Tax=Citreicella sp. C3M06 TaxID=2841564 RepID=UPI001C09F34D|nr:hypothetical protein [Citreicella sp. C3M06]MBU2961182.1 hypothetical protein [Citreicella sp. C3M06]
MGKDASRLFVLQHGVLLVSDEEAEDPVPADYVRDRGLKDFLWADAHGDHDERDPIDRVADDDAFARGGFPAALLR